jgi:putative ABC transport system permease protein
MWRRGRGVPVARRNVHADGRRLIANVVGVAAALSLILILQGLWIAFQRQSTAYVDNVGADLFVAEPGTSAFLGETSRMSSAVTASVASIDGVRAVAPIVARGAVLDLHGRKQFATLVGADPAAFGGPWSLAEGRAPRSDDEVALDASMAAQHDITVGNTLTIVDRRFEVVGLSDGTRSWMLAFVFVTLDAAQRSLGTPGTVSYVLVRTDDPATVADRIANATELSVLPVAEIRANDRALIARSIERPLDLMLALAFLAGTLIVGLTAYAHVVDRFREYGVLRALGAGRGRLFGIVLEQTITVVILGIVVSIPATLGAAAVIEALRPQLETDMTAGALAVAIAAGISMAILGAILPTRRVARLDPAQVYRS